jgi:hypothetical protein
MEISLRRPIALAIFALIGQISLSLLDVFNFGNLERLK